MPQERLDRLRGLDQVIVGYRHEVVMDKVRLDVVMEIIDDGTKVAIKGGKGAISKIDMGQGEE